MIVKIHYSAPSSHLPPHPHRRKPLPVLSQFASLQWNGSLHLGARDGHSDMTAQLCLSTGQTPARD